MFFGFLFKVSTFVVVANKSNGKEGDFQSKSVTDQFYDSIYFAFYEEINLTLFNQYLIWLNDCNISRRNKGLVLLPELLR